MSKTIHIIGAGPIGLVTAWQILKKNKNFKVIVYEKNKIVGGMCRTWKWRDYLLDTGPHIFHTPDKNLAKFWEKEFSGLFIKGNFWCKNVSGKNFNEYWDYPLSWESLSNFPKKLKTKILEELDNIDVDLKLNATTYSDYVKGMVGETLSKMFYTTYPEKVWGIPTTKLTPEWAPKRISFRNKIKPFYDTQWNAVGKYGTGSIYENIKEKILKLGGKIRFNYTLTKINHKNNKINELIFDAKTIKVKSDDIVISSLPITLTLKLLGKKVDLQFRGIRSVYLAFKKEQILKDNIHWLYYGDTKIDFNRVTEPKKMSKYVSPRKSTYLTLEITYNQKDKIDMMDEKTLVKRILEQVHRVGLVDKKYFIAGSSNKEPFVYPIMKTDYRNHLSFAKSEIMKFQQLYSVGTGGDFNYADSQVLFHKAFDLSEIISNDRSKLFDLVRKSSFNKLNKHIKINNQIIGEGNKAFIIAEAGLNHNGSVNIAKKLIDSALASGCNAVKFQTFTKNSRVSKKVKSANYAEKIIGLEESVDEIFSRLSLPYEKQTEIFDYGRKKGIEIFSTPFDFESVDFLESLNVGIYKVASADLVNLPLIKYIASKGKPVILSTGMSNLSNIEDAINEFKKTDNPNLALLHCNSSYPAPLSEMNLAVINNLQKMFNIPVGLSDHTLGLFVSQTAITLGASIIERHLTLDRTMEGPDHILSSEPNEFKKLVDIRDKIPLVIGDGEKRIMPNEYETLNTHRKSIYAKKNIKKGDKINISNITIKGPGGGILPKYIEIILNRKATKDIEADTPIDWDSI